MKSFLSSRRGFTLIELLLVIGIIAILASIVIIAINPTKQLGKARNAQRRSDINTILNAVYQYAIDNNGVLPGNIPSGASTAAAKPICMFDTNIASCTTATGAGNLNGVNLRSLSGTYLVGIPKDPSVPSTLTASGTRYMIYKDASSRITVFPATTDDSETITASR
ncbi:MAG: type II secretion system protein [Candidatus Peribacteraceae bacterium]|jgi:type IV pilus assembly protein PilA